MQMHRRRVVTLLLSGVFSLVATGAVAQIALTEGKNFRALKTEQPTDSPNKIEVIEFFSYGCPHCFAFEPKLEPWVKALPTDIVFKRVPVAFNPEFTALQRLYYTLEALGKQETLHAKVFEAIHVQHRALDKLDVATEFAVQNGITADQFKSAFNSFGVQSRVRRANQLTTAYQVDGVPMLAIDGRYITSASIAGGHENSLVVANSLIENARVKRGLPSAHATTNSAPKNKVESKMESKK